MSPSVRPAGPDDVDAVLGLFDAAVARLVERGFTRQWGEVPWSTLPRRVDQVAGWLAAPSGSWLAESAPGAHTGFLHLGAPPRYVPPATGPEVYVVALVGSPAAGSRGAGRLLLGHAEREARRLGVTRLRVDCFSGKAAGWSPSTSPAGSPRWPTSRSARGGPAGCSSDGSRETLAPMIPFHLGALHPIEQGATYALAFGPFVLLAVVVWIRRRQDAADDRD